MLETIAIACLVGSADGTEVCVGVGVGNFVVGSAVGEYTGSDVGSSVGDEEGEKEGVQVGFAVDKSDGHADGKLTGSWEGRIVGDSLGSEGVGSGALSMNCILCDGSDRIVSISRIIPTIFSSTKNNSLSRNTSSL